MESDNKEITCSKVSFSDLVLSVLPWPLHKDLPECQCGLRHKISFGDLVRSVLPWPFHKDLPIRKKKVDEEEVKGYDK